jgi:chaperonin GroES
MANYTAKSNKVKSFSLLNSLLALGQMSAIISLAMKKPNIEPVAGYLLVKPQKQDKTTASGILIPDSHDEKPQQGEVLAVGEGKDLPAGRQEKSPCKVGDIVIYSQWGGKEYKLDDINYLILKFEDIMATIKL